MAGKTLWVVRVCGSKEFEGIFRATDPHDLWDTYDDRGTPCGSEYARVKMDGGWHYGSKVGCWEDDLVWVPFNVGIHWHDHPGPV